MPPSLKKIGPYLLSQELGAGGMATVHLAVQESLDRPVALKELHKELARDDTVSERFTREAKALAKLGHQNIIHIYDIIEKRGRRFMVLEYVDGIDGFELLQNSAHMPPTIAAIIGLHTARALEYAHFSGVIHRDLKPQNLMISKRGEVKLMDFGIARDETLEDLTTPGTLMGTVSYMSPEQIAGGDIDFRSDIFSFGTVLYQLLTGQKPFRGEDTVSVMSKIANVDYEALQKVAPHVPRALRKIVKRCLKRKPESRYSSTDKLRSDLEKVVGKAVKLNAQGELIRYLHYLNIVSSDEATTYIDISDLENNPYIEVEVIDYKSRRRMIFVGLAIAALSAATIYGAQKIPQAWNEKIDTAMPALFSSEEDPKEAKPAVLSKPKSNTSGRRKKRR